MKPFNLQEALAGKPVVTRDGRKVTEVKYFKTANDYEQNVIAVVGGNIQGFTLSGSFYSTDGSLSTYDLFMDTIKVTRWLNVYPETLKEKTFAILHSDKKVADQEASITRIACAEVTWEE